MGFNSAFKGLRQPEDYAGVLKYVRLLTIYKIILL